MIKALLRLGFGRGAGLTTRAFLFLATTGLAQSDWTWRFPDPAGYDLRAVTYGEGRAVAVGSGIVYSDDGLVWEVVGTIPSQFGFLSDIAYGNGEFVAVGNGGLAARSGDGVNWTYQTNENVIQGTGFNHVIFGLGKWIASDYLGHLYQSSDGLAFVEVELPGPPPDGGISGLGYNLQGGFLATAVEQRQTDLGNFVPKVVIYFSSDGSTWNSFEGPAEWFIPFSAGPSNPIWRNGQWFVSIDEENWVSPNGAQWTQNGSNDGPGPASIAYAEENDIVAGVGMSVFFPFAYNSLPGTGWVEIGGPVRAGVGTGVYDGYFYNDLTWMSDDARWVAVGPCGSIAWAEDVSQWQTVGVPTDYGHPCLNTVVNGLGEFHAADGRHHWFSEDGVSWTKGAEFGEGDFRPTINRLAARLNEMLALGSFGEILSTTDGRNWQVEDQWFDQEARPDLTFNAATYGQGRWIVVGEGGFVGTSAVDRSVWLQRDSGVSGNLVDVEYTGTNFVACGSTGELLTSSDGIGWNDHSLPAGAPLSDIAVSGSIANPIVVAVGSAVVVSNDHGETWFEPFTPGVSINQVIWAGNEFVGTGSQGEVWVSKDAINWARVAERQPFNRASQLAYNGDVFVMAANGIVTAPVRTISGSHTLTVDVEGPGSVAVYPLLDTYETGTPVTLTPDPFETFLNWSGDVDQFELLLELEMTTDYAVTANFFEEPVSEFEPILAGEFPGEISTRENFPWFIEERSGPDGEVVPTARSGHPVTSFEQAYLETYLFESGTLSFDWKVSTKPFGGFLRIYVNGVLNDIISGDSGWVHKEIELSGTDFFEVQWTFQRSAFDPLYDNAGWVTNVGWNLGGGPEPVFTRASADLVVGAHTGSDRVRVIKREALGAMAAGVPACSLLSDFFAITPGFTGGVSVAGGDVDGDGFGDLIAASAAGPAHVKIFEGGSVASGAPTLLHSFFAFPPDTFSGGVRLAGGDLDGDGHAEIVVGTSAGAAHLKVFDGSDYGETLSLFPFGAFAGGINVAVGNVDGSTEAPEIIVATGGGGIGTVSVIDASTGNSVGGYFPFPRYTGGVSVAAGDFDGDGVAEIITTADDAGVLPQVRIHNKDGSLLASFYAFSISYTGGVNVAAGDVNGDGIDEIIIGAATGIAHVRVIDGSRLAEVVAAGSPMGDALIEDFFAFDVSAATGASVATLSPPCGAATGVPLELAVAPDPASPESGPQVTVRFEPESGAGCHILQTSADLGRWKAMRLFADPSGGGAIEDESSGHGESAFFRVLRR